MVSFWPFSSGDSTSAESFERVLRDLSGKITRASARHDRFRQKQRRYKALWSLYTTFAYILVAAILVLVTGWDRWAAIEYSALAGGPVLIFGGRTAIDTYYDWRAKGTHEYITALSKQREESIEKLKKATKYNSTQQLLDKYGGSPSPRRPQPNQSKDKRKSDIGPRTGTPQSGRTGIPPPPTANVPRVPVSPPPTANIPRNQASPDQDQDGQLPSPPQIIRPTSQDGPGEEFAPNAFSAPVVPPPSMRRPSMYAADGPKWYDRIMDVVLGEDETSAKNRIALICQSCRLVNGQAPPGARTLQDIGKWRCSACHAWNGVESEEKQILQQITQGSQSDLPEPMSAVTDPGPAVRRFAAENGDEDEDEVIEDDEEEDEEQYSPPAASTRSRTSQAVKRG